MSTFKHLAMKVAPNGRRLAFSQVGEANSPRVLLCLPGLLETRASFHPLLNTASNAHGLRVISLDLCGRGDSDPLPSDSGYCMSLYLSDIEAFIRQEVFGHGAPKPRLDVIGTSMGGILGMYLAAKLENDVEGLLLNDIGLNLTWMSIYGLYEGMKSAGRMPEAQTLASRLGVTEGAVRDVQSPHHFDLPHHKDWKGMKFGHILNNFKGSVSLVYGGESGVCLPQQVQELQAKFAHLAAMRVEGATHPVPFSESVCAFVLQELKLDPIPAQIKLPEVMLAKDGFVQKQLPLEETLAIDAMPVVYKEMQMPSIQAKSVKEDFDNKLTPVKQTELDNYSGNDSDWRSRFVKWLSRFKQSESK
jgi:pimeloyl-ACP methyl ester carboxylesterase